jgi:hypothetical protein
VRLTSHNRAERPRNDTNFAQLSTVIRIMKKSTSSKNAQAPADGTAAAPTVTAAQAIPAKPTKSAAVTQTAQVPAPEHQSEANDPFPTTAETAPSLLGAIGTQITAVHAAVKAAFADVLLHAAKCGLLLLAAKDLVKVGGFEAWFAQSKFGFTKVTRCKYMRLAERLCEEARSKPGLLLSIETGADGLPAAFMFDELRLRTVITTVADGRSLSDLYIDWDIAKRSQIGDEGKTNRSSDPKQPESPKEVFGRWSGIVAEVPKIFAQLARGRTRPNPVSTAKAAVGTSGGSGDVVRR